LVQPRGNKGELASVSLSKNPERVRRVFLNGVPYEVERTWWHEERLIFKFAGIDSISAAEGLKGLDVCIPAEERAPLDEGEYYQSDFLGCEVFDVATGRTVGVIEDWQEYGGPPLLEVRSPDGREILIPFARSICREIDLAAKRVGVEIPEGLDEL
jgi:16S rRNA processing protein RimM